MYIVWGIVWEMSLYGCSIVTIIIGNSTTMKKNSYLPRHIIRHRLDNVLCWRETDTWWTKLLSFRSDSDSYNLILPMEEEITIMVENILVSYFVPPLWLKRKWVGIAFLQPCRKQRTLEYQLGYIVRIASQLWVKLELYLIDPHLT